MTIRNWPRPAFTMGAVLAFLSGCGIPPVDTKTISQSPARPQDMALAQKAVRACAGVPDNDNVTRALTNAGFQVTTVQAPIRGGRTVSRYDVQSPNDRVIVFYQARTCYVGVVDMTPAQSKELATFWVDAYDAKPNGTYGDGLSDHVSGAWRRYFYDWPNHINLYIAAYKTWPSGPYDPQNKYGFDIGDVFPNTKGAAVKLEYVSQCKSYKPLGKDTEIVRTCS